MLPAHGYPELKTYKHLVGHFGGAWMQQQVEFPNFPGPILMTTNCLIEPSDSYGGRLFTRNLVAWPGVAHIEGRDFSSVVADGARRARISPTKSATASIWSASATMRCSASPTR